MVDQSKPEDNAGRSRDLLTPDAVCQRYRVSRLTLSRWQRAPATNFPQPLKVNSRTFYWDRAELDAWDAVMAASRERGEGASGAVNHVGVEASAA